MGSGAAFLDYDGDGDQDLLLVNSTHWPDQKSASEPTQALYRNDGHGRFEDVTKQAGLDKSFFGMGVAVGDYDNDGDPDVYLTALGGGHLFRNDGGTFRDVTDEAKAKASDGWLTSACFFDMENDGDLDLFVCNYVAWSAEFDRGQNFQLIGTGQGRAYGPPTAFGGTLCVLLRNEGGTFTDVSEESGIHIRTPDHKAPVGKSLGVAPYDIDDDGLVDLAVANDTVPNFLFHNLGGGRFEEVGITSGIAFDQSGATRGAMGIDWGDFKNDGSLGLAIGNFANEMTALYVTDEPATLQFSDLANLYGLGAPTQPPLKFGLFFFDYDLDGRLDLLTTNGHLESDIAKVQATETYEQSAQLFWNTGKPGRSLFALVGPENAGPDLFRPVVGRGSTYADIDGDGDLDVVLTVNGGPARLFRNEGGDEEPLDSPPPDRRSLQPQRDRRQGLAQGRRAARPSPALPGQGLSLLGRAPPDLRPRQGGTGRRGHDHLALGEEGRVQGPGRRPPLPHRRGQRAPVKPVRSSLLPAGEGGRDGRMRVNGLSMGHVLRRCRSRSRSPSSAPSGHLLPGEKGRGDRLGDWKITLEGESDYVAVTIPHDRTYGSCRIVSCVIMESNGGPSGSFPPFRTDEGGDGPGRSSPSAVAPAID